MKSKNIWIWQALLQLIFVLSAAAAVGILGFIVEKENILESVLFFASVYGMVMGPALDPFVFRNPVAVAVSMGESRKGICLGLELTRVIYMIGIYGMFALTVIVSPFPDISAWVILSGYLGILLAISAISAIFSALTYQRGSNCVWLRLLEGVLSVIHLLVFVLLLKYAIVSVLALAEGILLTMLSVHVEKKVLFEWNYRA